MPLHYNEQRRRWESDSDVVNRSEYEAVVVGSRLVSRSQFVLEFPYAISRVDLEGDKSDWPYYYRTKYAMLAQLAMFRINGVGCTIHKYNGVYGTWRAVRFPDACLDVLSFLGEQT